MYINFFHLYDMPYKIWFALTDSMQSCNVRPSPCLLFLSVIVRVYLYISICVLKSLLYLNLYIFIFIFIFIFTASWLTPNNIYFERRHFSIDLAMRSHRSWSTLSTTSTNVIRFLIIVLIISLKVFFWYSFTVFKF